MKRRLMLGGAAALAAGVSIHRSQRGLDDAESAFWQMQFEQPAGGMLAMAALRGAPMLLNFWATWCAPCRREMPLLERFYQQRRAAGWRVLGLAVDEPAAVRAFLARLPVSFPIGVAGMGGVDIGQRLGNSAAALPFSVVFDPQGRAIEHKLGAVTEADLEDWVRG